MQATELFIKRPVMTTLVMLGLLFFGIVCYLKMPVSYLPAVEFPTIQVSATMSGANPETMASSVASPLEREFSSIAGLQSMSSVNSLGNTTITLPVRPRTRHRRGRPGRAGRHLPRRKRPARRDHRPRPASRRSTRRTAPILYIAVTSDALPMSTVNDYTKTFLTQTISTIPGVAQVEIYGEKQYAVRIRLDPRELASRQLGIATRCATPWPQPTSTCPWAPWRARNSL